MTWLSAAFLSLILFWGEFAVKNIMERITKLAEQRHIIAIRRGMLLCTPMIVLGSFTLVINNLSLAGYQELMNYFLGAGWQSIGQAVWNGSLGIMSILLAFSISGCLADSHPLVKNGNIHPLMPPLVAFACMVIIVQPFNFNQTAGIPFRWVGVEGAFLSVLTSLLAAEIFLRFCTIKKFAIWMFSDEADPAIPQALACIVPILFTLLLFAVVKIGLNSIQIYDIHQNVISLISQFLIELQNTPLTALIYIVLLHIFWFFGMHGSDILDPVMRNFYGPAGESNIMAAAANGHTVILTDAFFNSFVLIGGSGSTLCLIIIMLTAAKRGNITRLAQLSMVPGIFNVNELLLFGLPIVLNPVYLIPFVAVPVVLTLVTYLAMILGLVPVTTHGVDWTTPPLLSGYLATGSWKGAALQAFNMTLGAMMYLPFMKLAEKQKGLDITQAFNKFQKELAVAKPVYSNRLLTRQDTMGNLARIIAHDLKTGLANDELLLEYQPQINYGNRVIGVEALLRWPHKVYGRIAPPFIIAVAEEAEIIQDVGMWVFAKACCQLKNWRLNGISNMRMSINVSVTQLHGANLAENMYKVVTANGLSPQEIEIEITENIALNADARIHATLRNLHELGFRIAIDDFGMGHSSLLYLKDYPISTLKIDRVLIQDVVKDKSCQEIILSINSLCTSLAIDVIAEYVETEEQRDKLKQLGCRQYQGYLYSPALPPEHIAGYLQRADLGETAEQKPDTN